MYIVNGSPISITHSSTLRVSHHVLLWICSCEASYVFHAIVHGVAWRWRRGLGCTVRLDGPLTVWPLALLPFPILALAQGAKVEAQPFPLSFISSALLQL